MTFLRRGGGGVFYAAAALVLAACSFLDFASAALAVARPNQTSLKHGQSQLSLPAPTSRANPVAASRALNSGAAAHPAVSLAKAGAGYSSGKPWPKAAAGHSSGKPRHRSRGRGTGWSAAARPIAVVRLRNFTTGPLTLLESSSHRKEASVVYPHFHVVGSIEPAIPAGLDPMSAPAAVLAAPGSLTNAVAALEDLSDVRRNPLNAKSPGSQSDLSAQWTLYLETGITQARTEAAELEKDKNSLLEEFSQEALNVENLYNQARDQTESAAHNLKLAQKLCGSRETCDDCTKAPICGWCAVERQCVPGDHLGLFIGSKLQCTAYRFGSCDAVPGPR